MSKEARGAKVRFDGQDGYFIADIFRNKKLNFIIAKGPVTTANLLRPAEECSHYLHDFPKAGACSPENGVFIVPASQVFQVNPL